MNVDTDALTINRASLADQAYDVIKKLILDLKLKPGQTITEAELTEMLHISKSPVRTALIHLQRDGLVTSTPFKDTIVSPLDISQVRQLYEVRSLVEPYVLRKVTPQLQPADIATVGSILDRAESSLNGSDYPTFFGINTEFHGYFIHRYGNNYFWNTFQMVDYQMQRIRMISSQIMNHPQKQMTEHRGIFEAAAAGKADEAAEAMRLHILGYFDDLLHEIQSGHISWFQDN